VRDVGNGVDENVGAVPVGNVDDRRDVGHGAVVLDAWVAATHGADQLFELPCRQLPADGVARRRTAL
jgi:hypothetical protein